MRSPGPTRTLAACALAVAVAGATNSAQTAEERRILATLGPDGFAGLPPLATLVDASDAAIVGRVVGTGRLTLRTVPDAGSAQRVDVPSAGYRIAIDQVVFRRQPADTPPLASGIEIDVDMKVGRDSAQRFLDRRLPAAAGETCLLFLSARASAWTLAPWHLQVKRVADTAATLGGPSFEAYAVSPEWHGGAVDPVRTTRGPALGWASLIAAVRTLGARPIERVRP